MEKLTGARTLPSNFYTKVQDSLKSRFRVGLNMEVVDKNKISQVCVASVKRIVGKRLHVEYYNAEPDDNGCYYGFFLLICTCTQYCFGKLSLLTLLLLLFRFLVSRRFSIDTSRGLGFKSGPFDRSSRGLHRTMRKWGHRKR